MLRQQRLPRTQSNQMRVQRRLINQFQLLSIGMALNLVSYFLKTILGLEIYSVFFSESAREASHRYEEDVLSSLIRLCSYTCCTAPIHTLTHPCPSCAMPTAVSFPSARRPCRTTPCARRATGVQSISSSSDYGGDSDDTKGSVFFPSHQETERPHPNRWVDLV